VRDTATTLELHGALGGATRSLTTLISRLPPHSGKLPLHGRAVFCPLAWAEGQSTLDALSAASANFDAVVGESLAFGEAGDLVLREIAVTCECIRSMLGLLDLAPDGGDQGCFHPSSDRSGLDPV